MKNFISSQFRYNPLVTLFCSKRFKNCINKILDRALRIVFNDRLSSFEKLLDRNSFVSIHLPNVGTDVMQEHLKTPDTKYNLRRHKLFANKPTPFPKKWDRISGISCSKNMGFST